MTDYPSLQEEHMYFISLFLSFYYFTKKSNQDRMNRVSSKQMLSSHAKGDYFLKINKLISGGASFSLFDLYSYSGSFLLALKKINVFYFYVKRNTFLFLSFLSFSITFYYHHLSFSYETQIKLHSRTGHSPALFPENRQRFCSLFCDNGPQFCALFSETDGHEYFQKV
jgi:hypothetical protein